MGKLVETNRKLEREVGERRRAVEALQRQRDFIAAVLDTAGALVVVLDREGRIVRFNRTCENVTGYSFEEVRDRSFWELLLLPEEVGPVKEVFGRLRAGEFPTDFENFWLTKSGERRLIAWSNTVLTNEKGGVEHIVGTGIDITARKQAEEKLVLYRRVFLASSDGIGIADPKGTLVECNPAHQEFYGYRDGEAIGRPATAYLKREDAERLWRALTDEGSHRGEVRADIPDGTTRFVDLSVFPVRNDAGELIHFVGMGRDITEAKLAREALAMRLRYEAGLAGCSQALLDGSEERSLADAVEHLRQAADAGRAYIFENFMDEDRLCARQVIEACASGVESETSRPELQRLEYTDALAPWRELLGKNEPLAGPVRDLSSELRSIVSRGGVLSLLVLPIWVDGEWYGFIGFDEVREERVWGQEEVRLLRTASDMIGGYLARRRALEALRVSEERFRGLVENVDDVIYSLNSAGECIYLSPKFEDYTGFEPHEFIGRSVLDLINEEDVPAVKDWFAGIRSGEIRRGGREWRLRDKDGKQRWFVAHSSVLRGESGEVEELVGVAHDITRMKQLVEDLENANRYLRDTQTQLVQSEKMASLGRLVAGIAHEINTPVGSIASMHDTLMKATTKLCGLMNLEQAADEETKLQMASTVKLINEANRIIEMGTDRVTTIVRRLRSFARLDEAELVLADIHEGLEDTLTLVHHELKHQVTVHRAYGEIPEWSHRRFRIRR
jgi:PAS domain S-box-containing protein